MSTETDVAATRTDDGVDDATPTVRHDHTSERRRGKSIELRTLAVSVLVVVLVAALGVTGAMLSDKSGQVSRMNTQTADNSRAETIALNYAVGAAQMDFKDLASWRGRLTKGTSPDLTNRLNKAAESMEQIITPLQWTSSATPIVAKVRSRADGKYVVDSFVNVSTKNSQTPDGIDSTATYSVTIDSTNNWTITDVGGSGAALQGK